MAGMAWQSTSTTCFIPFSISNTYNTQESVQTRENGTRKGFNRILGPLSGAYFFELFCNSEGTK